MNKNIKNIIIIFLVLVVCFLFYQIKLLKKEKNVYVQTKNIEYKIDESISNRNNKETKFFDDFSSFEKEFYMNLKYCTPAELATNTEWEFSIYGYKDNKCVFQERQDFYVMDCNLPTDIMEKYAEDGLKIIYELEDLKKQNKSGMVQSGQYIHEINNNKDFCTRYSVQKKQN